MDTFIGVVDKPDKQFGSGVELESRGNIILNGQDGYLCIVGARVALKIWILPLG